MLVQDVRYAFRSLWRRPGMTALAVLCLGIGIGANTAMFAPVDVFMLRPLPYEQPQQLVAVWSTNPQRGWDDLSLSVPDFLDLRGESRKLDIAAFSGRDANLSTDGTPERLGGLVVSHNFFRVLGATPTMGRGFLPAEDSAGAPGAIILSHGLWIRRFGGERDVVGRTLKLDGAIYTVVGVMPERFGFPDQSAEMWLPLGIDVAPQRGSHYLDAIARFVDGATIEDAQVELSTIALRLEEAYPQSNENVGARVIPARDYLFDEHFSSGSAIATVAVAFLLLITTANVSNLLLAQAAEREREVAIRSALGAGRGRIMRQMLTETLFLCLLGGILGMAVAFGGVKALVSIMPEGFPRVDEIGVDGRVLLYALGVTFIAGALSGVLPAMQATRQSVRESLQEGGTRGSSAGRRGGRLRNAFVIAEVAMAMVLLASAGLLVKGFARLNTQELGFNPQNLLTLRMMLPQAEYPDAVLQRSFIDRAAERIRALPGVTSVAVTSLLPETGNSMTRYTVEGQDTQAENPPAINFRIVTPEYFGTMEIPLVRGRIIEATDLPGAPRVVVINELFAQRHWPDQDPIGKKLIFSSGPREIVGIVRVARELGRGEDAPPPMIYFAMAQSPQRSFGFAVRTASEPLALVGSVRAALNGIDPNQPVYDVLTMERRIFLSTQADGIMAKIMATLAVVALVLAVVGVYGVMTYSVRQRTREIGIRMTLGAGARDVVGMVVRQGSRLALYGMAIGLVLALVASQGLSIFLFGVNPFDPATFAIVPVALGIAAIVASYVPARWATRVDPLIALRSE